MGAWADLPNELATHVMEAVYRQPSRYEEWAPSYQATKDILSCTYVSHQFHAIAKPFLFRGVRLRIPYKRKKAEKYDFFPSLCRFTRAIVLEPHLGRYVHNLSVDSLGTTYGDFNSMVSKLNGSFDEQEVQAALSGEDTARPDLYSILKALLGLGLNNGIVLHGRSDGIFIVLLHLLPKLRLLHIGAESDLACLAYSCFGGFGGRVPAALQSISELSLCPKDGNDYTGGCTVDQFVPFMTLPSLRTMTVHHAFEDPDRPSWLQINPSTLDFPTESSSTALHLPCSPVFLKTPTGYTLLPDSSSLTSLSLKSSFAPCNTLNQILMLPVRLEKFEYEIGEPNDEPFCPSDFLPGLLSQASSLRELEISIEGFEQVWEDDDNPFIGSLSGMTALEILRIPLPVLLSGAEEFPEELAGDVSYNSDDSYDAFMNERGDEEGWPIRLPSSYSAPAGISNPLDDLLPPNLIVLNLFAGGLSFAKFIAHTGIPQTLGLTRQRVPSLRILEVSGDFDDHGVMQHILKRVPKLEPPMILTLFQVLERGRSVTVRTVLTTSPPTFVMGVWADLPDELATQVLRELCPGQPMQNERQTDRRENNLLQCTYVSRRFHSIAKPLLYRDIRLQGPPPPERKGRIPYFLSLLRFTRAIVLEPRMGKCVRRLSANSLGSSYGDFDFSVARRKQLVDEQEIQKALSGDDVARPDLSIIIDALPALGLSNGLVLHGSSDGIFIILLHLLPKLQVLNIEAQSDIVFLAYSCFGGFGGRIPDSLQSISELSLDARSNKYYAGVLEIDEFAPFMSLPSLRTMTVRKIHGEDLERHQWLQFDALQSNSLPQSPSNTSTALFPPVFPEIRAEYSLLARSSPITSLHLKSCAASCQNLSKILMLPMRLERFEYEVGDFDDQRVCPSDFLPGLLSQASSLKELVITTEVYKHDWTDDEPFIGSLSNMHALRILRVPLPIIFERVEELEDHHNEETDDRDDDGARDKEGWPHRLPARFLAPTDTRNPLDDLLPPNLTSLELGMGHFSFAKFIKRTGIPQSLTSTRHSVPSLIDVVINGEFNEHGVVRHLLKQIPEFHPPMKITIFSPGLKRMIATTAYVSHSHATSTTNHLVASLNQLTIW
ncbi:hypothetical protein DL93DRAFT_2230554 [Clavulina sp. PMI_390]|nr:hypothetical protein DL93DRAFT_2230554 [Clavulina sp. PMI_390]